MPASPALSSSVTADRLARDQHGGTSVQFPAKSVAEAQARARRNLRELLFAAFGGPGKNQQDIAKAAKPRIKRSERQIITYLKEEADAPHWVMDIVTEIVIAKTERLARRIEGQ